VILHEAAERGKAATEKMPSTLSGEAMAGLFRTAEKLIPEHFAFQGKHFERAIQLQERLEQGILASSTPLYPVAEVSDTLTEQRDSADFSIYGTLSMMTEYPHTPREIVNAGWLHKIERGPVWLYSVLNEDRDAGFPHATTQIDYQDHLLRKSIEISEVHRVLLCTP